MREEERKGIRERGREGRREGEKVGGREGRILLVALLGGGRAYDGGRRGQNVRPGGGGREVRRHGDGRERGHVEVDCVH